MATLSPTSAAQAAQLRALLSRNAHRFPPLASAVLLLVLAWLAARLLWAIFPTPAAARWSPPPPLPQKYTLPGHNSNAATATGAAQRLFGVYAEQSPGTGNLSAESIHALATAPETHLNLKLLGILADRAMPSQSRALVAGANGAEYSYALGQAVTSGVLLKAIFPDRVVLARKGRLETLRLEMNESSGSGADSNVPIAVAGHAGTAEKLSNIRTRLLSNPALAARFIRVRPATDPKTKQQIGYRIYPGPDRAAFKATGLHPGDIVTAVNGVGLTKPARTLQLLSELSQAQQVSLTVKRGSKTIHTTLNFGQ